MSVTLANHQTHKPHKLPIPSYCWLPTSGDIYRQYRLGRVPHYYDKQNNNRVLVVFCLKPVAT